MSLNPITRKEIFMAKAAGEKVPDITPVTREEIFLSRIAGGGSGGGGGSADILNADGVIKQEHLPEGFPYKTFEEGYILEECQPVFIANMGYFGVTKTSHFVEAGKEYTVTWNGTEYNCVVKIITSAPEQFAGFIGFPAMGNFAVVGGENTGEPFAILCIPKDQIDNLGVAYGVMPLDGSTEITLSIKGETEVTVPISREFLPVGYPYFVPGGETVLEPMMAVSDLGYALPIKENYSYIVNWDGVDYECRAVSFVINETPFLALGNMGLDIGVDLGEDDTGEPFLIINTSSSTTIAFESAAMISIKTAGIYVPIDERYIPSGGGLQIVNGSGRGSIRTKSAAPDDENYQIGEYAIALGKNAKAPMRSNIAIGEDAVIDVNLDTCVAIGYGTKVASTGGFATGKYNNPDEGWLQIGCGSSDSNRKNAMYIKHGTNNVFINNLCIKCSTGKEFKLYVADDGTLYTMEV